MIHLHAHTVIEEMPQQAIHRDIDIATTAITAIPSTQETPAILIRQQHPPGYEEPKAGESVAQSKYPATTQTQHHSTTLTLLHKANEPPAMQPTLLHSVLASPTPPHECMHVYDRAAQYDLQTVVQGITKHHMIIIERRIMRDIQAAIAPIII